MGDMAKAAALMSQLQSTLPAPAAPSEPVDSAQVDEATPDAGAPVQPVTPAAKPPVEDAIKTARLAALNERTAKLREQRAAQRAQKQDTTREQTLKQREEALTKQEADQKSRWENALKDPTQGFAALGYKPEQILQRLHDKLIDANTPEAKKQAEADALKELIQSEVGKFNPKELKDELAAVRAEIEQEKKEKAELRARAEAGEKRSREQEFVGILRKDGKYEDLLDSYDDDRIIALGYQFGQQLANEGKRFDYTDILDKMLDSHKEWEHNKEKRRQERLKKSGKTESQKAEQDDTPEPRAIGNGVASASVSGETRKLTKDERMKQAARMLKSVPLTAGSV